MIKFHFPGRGILKFSSLYSLIMYSGNESRDSFNPSSIDGYWFYIVNEH